MTTPSGAISFYDVNIELATPGGSNASLGQSSYRNLSGNTSGSVYMSNLRNKTNLLWGDTGSTYHPPITVYGGTYGTEQPLWYIDTNGTCTLYVPTDAGGDSFYTNWLQSYGPTSGYTVRMYSPSGFYDPNGSYVPPYTWSSYFYVTSQRIFYIFNATTGTIELQNQYNGSAIYMDWSATVYYYA
jgi:hypothetical protein